MEQEVEFVEELPKNPITLVSKMELPLKKDRDPNFGFIDRNKKAALLRLDNLVSYREAFEAFKRIDYYKNWTQTFAAEVRSGQYEASCKVPNIVVLTSPRTFSGGYWMAAFLKKAGAKIVGIPSGQAGNHFGSVLQLTLANTGIRASSPPKPTSTA